MSRAAERVRRAAFAAVLAAAPGCHDAAGPRQGEALALLRGEARWERHRPAAYTFEYSSTCSFCVGATFTWVRLTVRGGEVVGAELVGEVPLWAPPPSLDATRYPTVDELFAEVADLLRRRPDHFEADYDAVMGYPKRVSVDLELNVADDEWGWEVRAVTPLAVVR